MIESFSSTANWQGETALLIKPDRLWSALQVLTAPCPVPASPGVYGWYFRKLPGPVTTSGCNFHAGLPLLYVGISPRGEIHKSRVQQSLRSRIRYHLTGNAEGSTLRKTLGCLLREELGIELRRVGSGTRMTFSLGESLLSAWMKENVLVCWAECEQPWVLEDILIQQLCLPLNISGNNRHSFRTRLKEIRAEAVAKAKELPVLPR